MVRTSDGLEKEKHKHSMRSPEFRILKNAGKFPDCKGLYPDCPDTPSKENPMCKNCPILEED